MLPPEAKSRALQPCGEYQSYTAAHIRCLFRRSRSQDFYRVGYSGATFLWQGYSGANARLLVFPAQCGDIDDGAYQRALMPEGGRERKQEWENFTTNQIQMMLKMSFDAATKLSQRDAQNWKAPQSDQLSRSMKETTQNLWMLSSVTLISQITNLNLNLCGWPQHTGWQRGSICGFPYILTLVKTSLLVSPSGPSGIPGF